MKVRLRWIIFLAIMLTGSYILYGTVIKVGVYDNYPKVYKDDAGRISGIFPEILELIAAKEDFQIEYVHGSWNESLKRLESSEIDIMVDVAFSDERQHKYDFSQQNVLISWGCLYTKKDIEINSVIDLKGLTIAVMSNSILTNGEEGIYKQVERYNVKCKFIEVANYYEVFQLVKNNEVDVGITNRVFGSAFQDQYHLEKKNYIFSPTHLKYAFPKGTAKSKNLIPLIDKNLDNYIKDLGSPYYTVLKKYNLYPNKELPQGIITIFVALVLITLFLMIIYLVLRKRFLKQNEKLIDTNLQLMKEIEEHQKTHTQLTLSKENYRGFVENIPGLAYAYDQNADGIRTPIIETNRNEEFLGKEIAKSIKEDYNNFFKYIVEEDLYKLDSVAFEVESKEKVLDFEYRIKISENQIKWFRTIGRVRKLTNGKTRWQGVIIDIDDKKKAEQELEKYRSNLEKLVESRTQDLENKTKELEIANQELIEMDKLKSVFLASMSHELRTPLNSIIGFTGILMMGMAGELKEEQKRQLGIVKKSANHLLALINDILDISKIEAGKVDIMYETFNLNEIIEETILQLIPRIREKELSIEKNLIEPCPIESDIRRVKQIILNLLSNAVKFTEKGKILVETKFQNQKEVVIIVEDTGIGIDKQQMNKLFEPFQQIESNLTKKYEGTGLGLHLTRNIINLLHGDISVTSEKNIGTTFKVILPLSKRGKE